MPWLDRIACAAGRLVGTRGAVLCFHGIEVAARPSPSSMHVSLQHLESIVHCAQRLGEFVPLREFVTRYLTGRSTAGLIALTADDAYASWLLAEPVLGKLGAPLTLFAVNDALRTGSRFWWDRIEEAAHECEMERWIQFEEICGMPIEYRRGHPPASGVTRPLRQWILAERSGRWPSSFEGPLAQLENELGCSTAQRSMTEGELTEFMRRTGAEVGVHTASHPVLPWLPDHEMADEIGGAYDALRERYPATLPYLAIPYGLFDERALKMAEQLGMSASLTLEWNSGAFAHPSEHGLPRLCVVREQQPGVIALKLSRAARLFERGKSVPDSPYPVLPSVTT